MHVHSSGLTLSVPLDHDLHNRLQFELELPDLPQRDRDLDPGSAVPQQTATMTNKITLNSLATAAKQTESICATLHGCSTNQ